MLTLIGLISTAFGVSVAGALLPLISVEIFVVGIVLHGTAMPWWLLAIVIAAGQLGGKLLHYYAARGAIRMPRFLQRRKTTEKRPSRWRARLERFRDNCQDRPLWAGGVLLSSALLSIPPFFPTAMVAGWARVPVVNFLVTVFVGRFIRFAALALAPAAVIAYL